MKTESVKEPAAQAGTRPYLLIRSGRRTISMELREDGRVLVRAPYRMRTGEIDAFVAAHADWVAKHRKMQEERRRAASLHPAPHLGADELQALGERALREIPPRVRLYAAQMGVCYGRITIRAQKTRWGSCSARGNLNFNCLLMKLPQELVDYVVVHELAHLRHMDHSPAFWAEVERVLPDYRERRRALKECGGPYIEALRSMSF